MTARRPKRAPRPLNETALHELAIAYVGRFATTRAKLRAYLGRKIRERGWDGPKEPDLPGIAERFAQDGYVDDAGYALSKAQSLSARGYGKRRLIETLRVAGIEGDDGAAAREHSESEALAAALRFAERRRLGPFAISASADPKSREKAIAAMVRAGHSFALAGAIARLQPGAEIDLERLAEAERRA